MVDLNALRTNQVFIVATVAIAFLLGADRGVWLIGLLALCMAAGVVSPGNGPIQLFYRKVLLPAGVVKPNREAGSAAPHRFAQAMGAACLALSAILLVLGFDVAGWVLGFIVVALALVNLLFGFCAGCFVYLQLGRLRSEQAA
ncbi:MAG: DUF4395 domain-containing protein [Thermomicrobiales bacterium]|nr:DUF4395 domain-containing protein [Thermomicrobiales bacterium]MCO5219975.1 DUF4395 domain-containing protein [Thermomicrobiales bacterium]